MSTKFLVNTANSTKLFEELVTYGVTKLFAALNVDGITPVFADLHVQGATHLYTNADDDVAIIGSTSTDMSRINDERVIISGALTTSTNINFTNATQTNMTGHTMKKIDQTGDLYGDT